ncbi:hypothetical protein [Kitasatospora sp. NPDC002965]|uniref:hypothetical protein n=1 Tax=Kitasatospora sp. NPDC002965 TaxID=3154775 RepID=UPI0033B50D89
MRRTGAVPPPDATRYRVTYAVAGTDGVRQTEVTVVPGYSQESDIPAVLAARLTGNPADARLVTVLALRAD